MTHTVTSSPGRGRPPKVTSVDLERLALQLWDERGYEDVPLADVAAVAGVTTRTIFRYFRSKSDIVWNGLDNSIVRLREHLEASPPEWTLASRLRYGVVQAVTVDDHPDTRARLRIISRTADLQHGGSAPIRAWHAIVQDWVAEQIGTSPDDLVPGVIASAVQAATFKSLMWWSTQGPAAPGPIVDRALQGLEDVCRVR